MRYKLTIEYDGTNLLGWQEQQDGPSVQDYLQKSLSCFTPMPIDEHSEASTGKRLQTPNAADVDDNDFSEAYDGASTERRPAAYLNVHEEASTGKRLQTPNAADVDDNDFSEVYDGASTERRPAAYLNVREEASTGKRLQTPNKIIVYGAGRTDAGVHALAQVAHFDMQEDLEDWKLREAMNARLRDMGAPVSIISVEKTDDNFHARFSAKGRGYTYRLLNRRAPAVLEKNRVWWVPVPIDIEKMREGAKHLLGHHDFSSFRAAACQAKSPIKTLDKLDILQKGDEIVFMVAARSFLHHQVRNMVGTLKMVGDGHLQPDDVKRILAVKDRKAAGPTAPACGLYLSKVVY